MVQVKSSAVFPQLFKTQFHQWTNESYNLCFLYCAIVSRPFNPKTVKDNTTQGGNDNEKRKGKTQLIAGNYPCVKAFKNHFHTEVSTVLCPNTGAKDSTSFQTDTNNE